MKPSQGRTRGEAVLVGTAVLGIDAYKAIISPIFAGSCRFYPTCSQFAREALLKHGIRGVSMAAQRILKCRPYGGRGFDPVP